MIFSFNFLANLKLLYEYAILKGLLDDMVDRCALVYLIT